MPTEPNCWWPADENMPQELPQHHCVKFNPPGDGNCFYWCLLKATNQPLDLLHCFKLHNELNQYPLDHQNDTLHPLLPLTIKQWVINNMEDLGIHIYSRINSVPQYAEIMSDATPGKCEWGSNLEACAFAEANHMNIAIYNNTGGNSYPLLTSKSVPGNIKTVCLLYSHNNGSSHYQLLTPTAMPNCNYIDHSKQTRPQIPETTMEHTVPKNNNVDGNTHEISHPTKYTAKEPINEIKNIIQNLCGLTLSDLQSLYNAVSSKLEKRNGWVVDCNPILTAILGCNTNSLLLGSSEQSKAAANYLGPYVNKNKTPLIDALDIVWDSIQHAQKYPSIAEDNDRDKRFVQYVMTRILNKLNSLQEISDTQAAAALLGLTVSLCSENFKVFDISSYIKYISNETKRLTQMMEQKINCSVLAEDHESNHDEKSTFFQEHDLEDRSNSESEN